VLPLIIYRGLKVAFRSQLFFAPPGLAAANRLFAGHAHPAGPNGADAVAGSTPTDRCWRLIEQWLADGKFNSS
jgi:hypothetical protein